MERPELICTMLRASMNGKYPGCEVEWSRHEATSTVDFTLITRDGKRLVQTLRSSEVSAALLARNVADLLTDRWLDQWSDA